MGKGRKPKPPALRVLTGVRSREGYAVNSPMPESAAPDVPHDLDGIGLEHWNFLVPRLLKCRVLTEIDAATLEGACRAYARYREAEAAIAKDGAVQCDHNGVLRKSPWVAISHESLGDYFKASALLGLSPADRARLKVTPEADKGDALSQFRNQA